MGLGRRDDDVETAVVTEFGDRMEKASATQMEASRSAGKQDNFILGQLLRRECSEGSRIW